LGDALALGRVLRAVRSGDDGALQELLEKHALWAEPNPRVLDLSLQQLLGTEAARFPLLWVAALHGGPSVFESIVLEISRYRCPGEELSEDIEGWLMPSVMFCCQREPVELLQLYFSLYGTCKASSCSCCTAACSGSLLRDCLLKDRGIAPLKLLLSSRDPRSNVAIWPDCVAMLVENGGGFPHGETAEDMMHVGSYLLNCCGESGIREFQAACSLGGDAMRPRSPAFAGLFLSLLDVSVLPQVALISLLALVEAGLRPDEPLTGEAGLWPLHAAARHDRVHMLCGLLALRANPHSQNRRGQTALDVARGAHSNDSVAALRRAASRRPRWEEVIASIASSSLPKVVTHHDVRSTTCRSWTQLYQVPCQSLPKLGTSL